MLAVGPSGNLEYTTAGLVLAEGPFWGAIVPHGQCSMAVGRSTLNRYWFQEEVMSGVNHGDRLAAMRVPAAVANENRRCVRVRGGRNQQLVTTKK